MLRAAGWARAATAAAAVSGGLLLLHDRSDRVARTYARLPDDEEYLQALRTLASAGCASTVAEQPASPAPSPAISSAVQPPNTCPTVQRVLVVGGGIMGCSAAYSLARRGEGHSVTLIDTAHPIRSSWGQERCDLHQFSTDFRAFRFSNDVGVFWRTGPPVQHMTSRCSYR